MKNIEVKKIDGAFTCQGFMGGCPKQAFYIVKHQETDSRLCHECAARYLGEMALTELLK